jgi:Glycosyl transferase family 2
VAGVLPCAVKVTNAMTALVSCLCVTEGRPAFMPWLLWGFDRQTHPEKELIVVDSSPIPWSFRRANVRVIAAPPGTNVPTKRNLALDAAQGKYLAWFDDDDWQHPERLERLFSATQNHSTLVGSCRSWFIDVFAARARPYDGRNSLIFNTALFQTELAREVRFNEQCHRASDTPWLRQVRQRPRQRELCLATDCLSLWLCHDQNISNPRRKRQFSTPLEDLQSHIGIGPWGDTTERLLALRQALPASALGPVTPQRERLDRDRFDGSRSTRNPRASRLHGPNPLDSTDAVAPVSAPADLPLDPTTVSDPSVVATLEPPRLENGSTVFESVKVIAFLRPQDPTLNHRLIAHFKRQLGLSECEIITVHPTTDDINLENLRHSLSRVREDFLLVLRPQVLFNGKSGTWLPEGVRRLRRTPELALVTAHPGKPRGPLGTARSMAENSHLDWDNPQRAFRWRSPPHSYFLTRRAWLTEALELEAQGSLTQVIHRKFCKENALALALPTLGTYAVEFSRELQTVDAGWIDRIEAERLPKSYNHAFLNLPIVCHPRSSRDATHAPIMIV